MVSELAARVPSVSIAVPETPVFMTGLVKVLLVKVCEADTPATVALSSFENTIPAEAEISAFTIAKAFKRLLNSPFKAEAVKT
ncbi:MAG: hypothetical protein PHE73_08780 [Sulfurovaceae bacterium]|nr:hypothetical protein [Sulfurovaceae bacterium]